MPNPDTLPVFGICPVCGRTGLDDDEKLTGYKLIEFQGKYMCELCKIQIEDREHDSIANQRQVEEEEFRNAIGVRRTVQ